MALNKDRAIAAALGAVAGAALFACMSSGKEASSSSLPSSQASSSSSSPTLGVTCEVLARQDATTSEAVIAQLGGNASFVALAVAETADTAARDAADDDKLQAVSSCIRPRFHGLLRFCSTPPSRSLMLAYGAARRCPVVLSPH